MAVNIKKLRPLNQLSLKKPAFIPSLPQATFLPQYVALSNQNDPANVIQKNIQPGMSGYCVADRNSLIDTQSQNSSSLLDSPRKDLHIEVQGSGGNKLKIPQLNFTSLNQTKSTRQNNLFLPQPHPMTQTTNNIAVQQTQDFKQHHSEFRPNNDTENSMDFDSGFQVREQQPNYGNKQNSYRRQGKQDYQSFNQNLNHMLQTYVGTLNVPPAQNQDQVSQFQSNASVYGTSARQYNELDEDGHDISKEINQDFNREYCNENGEIESDTGNEMDFYLPDSDRLSYANYTPSLSSNRVGGGSNYQQNNSSNYQYYRQQQYLNQLNKGQFSNRVQKQNFSAFSSAKNSARYLNSVRDEREAGFDSELKDELDALTGYEVQAVRTRAVVASQSDFQQKFKTEMCRNWELNGKCKFGVECTFAHGAHELLQKSHIPTNYRTKECKNFYTYLYCSYGERCQFYHAIKPHQFEKPKKKQIKTYSKSLIEVRDIASTQVPQYDPSISNTLLQNRQNVLNNLYVSAPYYQNDIRQMMSKVMEHSNFYKRLKVFLQIPFDREKAEKEFNTLYQIKPTQKYTSAQKNQSSTMDKKSIASMQTHIKSGKKSQFYEPIDGEVSHFNPMTNLKNEKQGKRQKNHNQSNSNSSSYNAFQNNNSIKLNSGSTFTATSKKQNIFSNHSVGGSSCQFQFHQYQQQKQKVKNDDKSIPQNYQYHSPNHQQFNYQVPISQLPNIKQFFPDLGNKKSQKIMQEIKEINNDWENVVPMRRERTNSDNWADNVQVLLQNDIKQELEKPSNQLISSFTENMVYLHPPASTQDKNQSNL